MSLRGAQRRGNLKVKGMASRTEARRPCETDFKHFGNKNGRFSCKTYHFRVIARPHCGRGNLKAEGMASRTEAREYVAKRNPYRKKQEIRCFVLRLRSLFQGSASSRATIFRSGMTNRSVKNCRVGRKMRPPRNDRIGRLD